MRFRLGFTHSLAVRNANLGESGAIADLDLVASPAAVGLTLDGVARSIGFSLAGCKNLMCPRAGVAQG